jgi:hypothetical protein
VRTGSTESIGRVAFYTTGSVSVIGASEFIGTFVWITE